MKRHIPFIIALATLLAGPQLGQADTVFEGFDYPAQNDTTGFDGGELTPTYRLTTTGSYGTPADTYIATFAEGAALSAGIADVGGGANFEAFFNTSAKSGQPASQNIFVGMADLPGFGDTTPAGPFATLFSPTHDLTNASGSIDVWAPSGVGSSSFRLLAEDISGNELVTNFFTLGSSSQTFGYTSADFVNDLGPGTTDGTQIASIGIEFFIQSSASGDINPFQFRIDNFVLNTIPEPGSFTLLFAAGCASSVLIRRRRSK